MKTPIRALILFPLALAGQAVHSQFDAIPDSNATWTTSFWIGPGYPYEGYFYEYDMVQPDTLIGGDVFKRLLQTNNLGGPFYSGALRDNGAGQVYYCPSGSTPVLLYDFDVQPGDTVSDVNGIWLHDVVVYSVDTIVVNGTDRKRIGVECDALQGFAAAYWIQGIGGTGGLLHTDPCPSVSGTGTLICMTENDTVQYGLNVGGLGACDIFLGMATSDGSAAQVAPNPSTGIFTVSVEGGLVPACRVLDLQGREVLRTVGGTIDLGTRPSGTYLLIVSTDRGSWRTPLLLER